ncbi:MAG: XRE family transcriptional regulator [Eubacterium sp.]|nr:XRE family transcriptional regulator [Eubacterium sp.]
MNYLSHNIALNLQQIRKAKGMSLDSVAEQTGVSKSMLAMIERDDANPSIGVIGKIMSGLRVSLEDLTKNPLDDAYLVNIDKLEPTKDVEGQYKVWTCIPISDNHVIEIYRIELAPGGVYESDSHGDHTKEYLTMQKGVLTLEESGRLWTLHQNKCLRFASDRPHVYRNPGNEPAVCMSFFLAR